jgi:3-hydroxyisobutyrate dehydrogenase
MPGTPAENDYVPGFMVDLMVKDLGLAAELARQSEVDAEFGEKARTIYQALQKRGFGRSDFSIVLKSVLNSLD